jgi:hypothetical protein
VLNTIRLSNGEEIITENYEEIIRNVIKSEMNAIVLRNILEQYQLLLDIFNIRESAINKIMDKVKNDTE